MRSLCTRPTVWPEFCKDGHVQPGSPARCVTGELRVKLRNAASVLCFIGILAFRESAAQADPFWLKSWNEAQKTRPAQLTSCARIAPAAEPGTPLIIRGTIFKPDGRTPAPHVVVHAYHRDREGFDFGPNDRALTTWRLQGWAQTDDSGRFEFRTVRPAPDHMGRDGAHVHFTVESRELGRQWAPTLYFSDDPPRSGKEIAESADAGEFAWVRPVRMIGGIQETETKIRLKDKADF
jgi:protocatechuate 3,4-dioxygenase beta subunit